MREYRHYQNRKSWSFNHKTFEEFLERNEYLKGVRKKLMDKKLNK